MFLVQALERKEVIRFFGTSLVLAPFVNNAAKMNLLEPDSLRWSVNLFWNIFQTSHVTTQILSVSSVVIGVLMFKGSKRAWNYALFLLGCYIVVQLIQFREAIKTSKVALFFLLTNVAAFLFIADQLVWKVKVRIQPLTKLPPEGGLTAVKPQDIKPVVRTIERFVEKPATDKPQLKVVEPKSAPKSVQHSHKTVAIQFQDYGIWGELRELNSKGFLIQSKVEKLPFQIEARDLDIKLRGGVMIRARLSKQEGRLFHFTFQELSADQTRGLNSWLIALKGASPLSQ